MKKEKLFLSLILTSYAEFFQCYFSSKRIGVIESDFTYSTFDELIEKSISLKVGTSQMATYISDDGINIIRFIFYSLYYFFRSRG